jgi:type I restriction enzyme, S subunit
MSNAWPHAALIELVTQRRDAVKIESGVDYRLLGVRWYGEGAFHRETVTRETSKATTVYKVTTGQFIYNRLFAGKGAFGLVLPEFAGAFVSNEFPLFDTDTKRLSAEYLNLYFQQKPVWDYVEAVSTGTTASRNRWKESQFLTQHIPLPPLPTQERIVEVIGAIDGQIAALDNEAEALEAILESLRSDLPETEHQPIGDVLLGIDSGKSVQAGEGASAEDEYRILKLSAVQRGWFKPSEAKRLTEGTAFSASHVVKSGDLLITRANTPERVGFVAIARSVPEGTFMPDLIWRLRVDESRVSTDYLEHALSSRQLRTRISGTSGGTSKSMVKINKHGFSAIRVPIPSLPEQSEYVRRCDAVVEGITATRAEAAHLPKVRAALLSGLLDRTIDIESAELEF